MTEIKAVYNAGDPSNNRVDCGGCGAEIGHYIQAGDKVLLKIDHVRLKDAWGECDNCGAEWIWHSSDQKLELLIERIILRRNSIDIL